MALTKSGRFPREERELSTIKIPREDAQYVGEYLQWAIRKFEGLSDNDRRKYISDSDFELIRRLVAYLPVQQTEDEVDNDFLDAKGILVSFTLDEIEEMYQFVWQKKHILDFAKTDDQLTYDDKNEGLYKLQRFAIFLTEIRATKYEEIRPEVDPKLVEIINEIFQYSTADPEEIYWIFIENIQGLSNEEFEQLGDYITQLILHCEIYERVYMNRNHIINCAGYMNRVSKEQPLNTDEIDNHQEDHDQSQLDTTIMDTSQISYDLRECVRRKVFYTRLFVYFERLFRMDLTNLESILRMNPCLAAGETLNVPPQPPEDL